MSIWLQNVVLLQVVKKSINADLSWGITVGGTAAVGLSLAAAEAMNGNEATV